MDAPSQHACLVPLEPRLLLAAAPVIDDGELDLHAWVAENFTPGSSNWTVAGDGRSVTQSVNGNPAVFFGGVDAMAAPMQGRIRQSGGVDDDHIGFVLGWTAGDFTAADADFLIVDWKMASTSGQRGIAVSRLQGNAAAASVLNYWQHTGVIVELARGAMLGDTGWARDTEYTFAFDYAPDRLRVWVDGVLEIDLDAPDANPFPAGALGFYNNSQEGVTYTAFASDGVAGDEGRHVTITKTFTDADGNTDHVATIDWGDGAITPATITYSGGVGTVSGVHAYDDDGIYTVTVTVADADGSDDDDLAVTLANLAPEANDAHVIGREEIVVTGHVGATDVDGDTITYALDTDGSHGAAGVDPLTGAWTYTPDADFHGSDSFTLRVSDEDGGSTTVTIHVEIAPVNDAPTATADPLILDQAEAARGQVDADDIEGDTLQYRLKRQPEHGSVRVNRRSGAYVYTPVPTFSGLDSFVVQVRDGHGGKRNVTVSVTVNDVNVAPITGRQTIHTRSLPVGGRIEAHDVDGDRLRFTLVDPPRGSTIRLNRRTGAFEFVSARQRDRAEIFTVAVSDGLLTSIARVRVIHVHDGAGLQKGRRR